MQNIENRVFYIFSLLFISFAFLFLFPNGVKAACWAIGENCGLDGSWYQCNTSCMSGGCTTPAKCCGDLGSAQPKCEPAPGTGCYIDCEDPPPIPDPPSCHNFRLSGPPDSNPDLTTSPNVNASWAAAGNPTEYKFEWGPNGGALSQTTGMISYSGPPRPIDLSGGTMSLAPGWYQVRMTVQSEWGSGTCSDTILYDSVPTVTVFPDPNRVYPNVSRNFGRWSGTLDPNDNGTLNGGEDHNPIEFGIRVTDPDGYRDIRMVNFGIGPRAGDIASDIWDELSCDSDPLESVFKDSGVGVTFNFNASGNLSDWNHICGNSPEAVEERYVVSDVSRVVENNTTVWIYFTISFKNGMLQGYSDVWAKASDQYGMWSRPDGKDLYSKFGIWGVDTTISEADEFGQKQPMNAKSLRVWWDATDIHSGVVSIDKGCSLNLVEESGNELLDRECLGLRETTTSTWLPPITMGSTSSNPLQYPNYINKIENIYINPDLIGGESYGFIQWVTDGANNKWKINSQERAIGQKWLQVIQGDVHANSLSGFVTPNSEYLVINSPPPDGHNQFLTGYTTVMFKSASSNFPNNFGGKGGTRTTQIVKGQTSILPYNFDAGLDTVFTNSNNLFDRLKQEAFREDLISPGSRKIVLCGYAEAPCASDERVSRLNQGWFEEDGIYHVDLTGDTTLLGIESNMWKPGDVGKVSIILLVEGNGDTYNFGIIPSLDPYFNLIIIARNANVLLKNAGDRSEHAFEPDFLSNPVATSKYCVDNDCYNVSTTGKYSGDLWNRVNYKDDATYLRYDDSDEYGEDVVDPGLDVFGFYVMTDGTVNIVNEEEDYDNALRDCISQPGGCATWDGDFERMEMRGGIVASNIIFGRNLVALDNSWMPAEKFIYGAQYIDAYVKAAKNVREQKTGFGQWEEVGLDY